MQVRIKPSDAEKLLAEYGFTKPNAAVSKADMVRRGIPLSAISAEFGGFEGISPAIMETVETDAKYEGYLAKEQEQIDKARRLESKKLPDNIDYSMIKGLRLEARQKLNKVRPANLGQASRISGVSPADIAVLMVFLST